MEYFSDWAERLQESGSSPYKGNMEEEIVIDLISLFRCWSCGHLITVNDIESGEGCPNCSSRRFVVAKKVTDEENKRLEEMYKAGTLKLFLSGAKL